MKSAQQMMDNWVQAMGSPQTSQKYKQGIAATQVNPMQLAATPEALALYAQRTQESVVSGKRAAKLQAVPMERWRSNALNVGATQLSVGASKAKDKVSAHFQKWAPIYQQAADAAKSLPKGGLANAMARVQAAVQVMMQAAGRA